MKPFDSLVPYILAGGHPLYHMSFLFTGLVLVSIDQDKFYEIPGTCEPVKEAKDKFNALTFMLNGKYEFMFLIMTGHLAAIAGHYLYQILNHYDFKTLANLCLVAKTVVFLWIVMDIQTGITFEECQEVTDKSHVMAWLTYEVVGFYLNIISVVLFLLVASCKKYKTIREREGLAGKLRKKQDFLQYCREDIHWW